MYRIYAIVIAALLVLAGVLGFMYYQKKTQDVPPAGLAGSLNLGDDGRRQEAIKKARPIISGKVEEVILRESFSYVRLKVSEDREEWVALVHSNVKVGDTIKVEEQAVLTDFQSKSLNRTFAKIIFGTVLP